MIDLEKMTDREIDTLIAEKLFGLSIEHDFYPPGFGDVFCRRCAAPEGNTGPCARHYSTDPNTSAQVLDEIERRGWYWEWFNNPGEHHYIFEIALKWKDPYVYTGESDNRYRAVCLAVLKAIGK